MNDSVVLQFTKEDISSMCFEVVSVIVDDIIAEYSKIDRILKDEDLSKCEIREAIGDIYKDMANGWKKLGKARLLARKIKPDLETLFDTLDKSIDVSSAIDGHCLKGDVSLNT